MLSRIRLKGFKSFLGQTALQLGPGVNVIVGPNGSGKSNLAEAIIWALGEQRSGRLRASGMGEVLHAGGRGAQAQIAEVELVLESSDANPDPAELAVSRRLTRAGDADYSVNGQACRLLDMQDALAARGLGPDALAIVRQGQVEALCNSRPAERRAMVEEAAGVAAAKRRRRRAERKLARIAENVDRARDLEEELALQGRRLARQAGAARRAARLDRELVAARRALLDRRVKAAQAEEEAMRAARATWRERVEGARATRDEAQAAVQSLERAREESLASTRDAEHLAMAVRVEADRVSGRAELARERQVEERERAQRLGHERDHAAARLDELRAAAREAEAAAAEANASLGETEERARAAEAEADSARRAATEARDRATARAGAIAALEHERGEIDRSTERAEAALASATEHVGEYAAAGADALRRLQRREEVATELRERRRVRRARAEAAADDARAALAAAQERRRTADARVRALPSPDEGSSSSLSADLVVADGLERAVATALGAAAEAEIVESASQGVAVVDGGAGAAVVPAPDRGAAEPPPCTATRLLEVIEGCPEPARTHVERLLADVWLVDDLAEVPAGTPGVFVTAAGHLYRPVDGIIVAPAGAVADRAARRRAEAEAEAAAGALADAERAVTAAEDARSDAVRRDRAAERSVDRAVQALAAARAEQSARATRHEEARARIEDSKRQIAEGAARATEIAAELEALRREHAGVADAVESARRASDGAASAWRESQTALADATTVVAAARARAAEMSAQLAAAEAAAAAPVPRVSEDPLATRAAEALGRAAAAMAPLVEAAQARAAECAAESRRVDAELAAARKRREQLDEALNGATGGAQQAEVDHAVAAERLTEARRAAAEGPAEPEGADDAPELPEGADELARHVEALEAKRASIGAVNPLAEGEQEELEQRQSELAEQMADLEAASAALRERMEELDAAVAAGYGEVFSVLQGRFGEVAEILFPGGTGRLREVADDSGEPGIEIEVVPAGKRARSLSLLSGGEKSLVALAFCLSLAMVRPAPFYLLDEVEAALDDVNLRRFLGLVRKLAPATQFILITHQQPTVEIADTLFGVTMGGEGESQILSRRLDRHVEGPAKPYVRRQLQALPGGRA